MTDHFAEAYRLARRVATVATRAEKRAIVRMWAQRLHLALSAEPANPLAVPTADVPPKQQGAEPVRREAWSPCAATAPKD